MVRWRQDPMLSGRTFDSRLHKTSAMHKIGLRAALQQRRLLNEVGASMRAQALGSRTNVDVLMCMQ